MAPKRSGPDKQTKPRGRPPKSSNNKVTKPRGRPPGSRNSLPTSKRGPKPNAAKAATSRKNKDAGPEVAQLSGAKRKRATGGEDGSEQTAKGKKRGRPARISNTVPEEEEEADELSFTQAEVVPVVRKHKPGRKEQTGPAKKRGRPSRTQDEVQQDHDEDDTSARQGKTQDYVQLAPRTRRIAREVIETWPHVSAQVLDQIIETLRDAKKDIVNTQRDEERAMVADETLGSMIRMLARMLSGSRIPPQAKDFHFNIDKLTERYAQLFRELTTARHSQQLLSEQVKVAQHLLRKDEEGLEQLKKNARDWKATWKRQEKQGRMHPLLKKLEDEEEVMDDGPEEIGWKAGKAVKLSMMDRPDAKLAPYLEQLRRNVESMQGNHEQVRGMEVGVLNAQAALDSVLFRHASAEQYARL